MKLEQYLKQIQTKLPPISFFYGDEDFLKQEAAQALRSRTLEPGMAGFNEQILYGNEIGLSEFVENCQMLPFGGKRRFIHVKDAHKMLQRTSKKEQELFKKYVETPSAASIVFLEAPAPSSKNSLWKFLEKNAVTVPCFPPYEKDLRAWTMRQIQKQKKRFTPKALNYFLQKVDLHYLSAFNELQKVCLMAGDAEEITLDIIQNLISEKEPSVFDLLELVGMRTLGNALEMLQKLQLQSGFSAVGLISLLTNYFASLWQIRLLQQKRFNSQQIARQLRISEWMVKMRAKHAVNFSRLDLNRIFAALEEADWQLKTSVMRENVILTQLLVVIIKGDVHV